MATETELAYAAGIVDGEGCIRIAKNKRPCYRNGAYPYMQVWVGNTSKWLISWLGEHFGGGINSIAYCKYHKPYLLWRLQGRKAANFLQAILPYLGIKKSQAELALEFQKPKQPWHRRTEEECMLQEAQFLAMKELNKKGDN